MVNLELQKHEVMFLSPTIFFKSKYWTRTRTEKRPTKYFLIVAKKKKEQKNVKIYCKERKKKKEQKNVKIYCKERKKKKEQKNVKIYCKIQLRFLELLFEA